MKITEAQIKDITTSFFRYWWNSQGSNTDQGFDDWWIGIKDHYMFLDVPEEIRQPKKIDMSVCIESGIDCEFSVDGEQWFVNKLKTILTNRKPLQYL